MPTATAQTARATTPMNVALMVMSVAKPLLAATCAAVNTSAPGPPRARSSRVRVSTMASTANPIMVPAPPRIMPGRRIFNHSLQ